MYFILKTVSYFLWSQKILKAHMSISVKYFMNRTRKKSLNIRLFVQSSLPCLPD